MRFARIRLPGVVEDTIDHGTHACDYLLTVDMEMEPTPGYDFANWELGYGDVHLVPDLSTLALAGWTERSAFVLCDVVDDDGAPVGPAPRAMLRAQLDRLAGHGLQAKAASELEFFLYDDSYRQAAAKGHAGLTSAGHYIEDYHLLQGGRVEPYVGSARRVLRHSGVPVENSKGEWGRGGSGRARAQQPLRRGMVSLARLGSARLASGATRTGALMSDDRHAASRVVSAPSAVIFALVCDPASHAAIDGSGMVEAAIDARPMTAVGDTFDMDMDRTPLGDIPGLVKYKVRNQVTRFEPGRLVEWTTGGIDQPPVGHVYGWELEELGETGTGVTHYCDWSGISDEARARRPWPVVPLSMLEESLVNLDRLATG